MSVLDICPTMESTKPRYRYHHHHHHRQSSTTASYDTISTTSSRNSSFEVLFSRLLDALIFTSAIAITAYSYLTGTLIDKPAALIVENKPLVTYTPKRNLVLDPIEDAKRKRTQQWAEDQLQIPTVQLKKRSYSTGKVKS
jgi:cell division protein FtsL